MSLIEKLPLEEIDAIEAYRMAYAYSSGAYHNGEFAETPYILREWAKCKNEYLYKLFGEQFIISKPIKFEKTYNELVNQINKLNYTNSFGRLNRGGKTFYEAYYNFLYPSYGYETHSFDTDTKAHLDTLMYTPHLIKNTYEGETFYVDMPNGKKLKVQHGCKISKILGKIAAAYNIPGFEDYRICLSQIINEKETEGIVHLSIHPLDYMTMSDNECGWDSCMSWRKEGCYRQGTVEMMNSPAVIVAYISSKDDMDLPADFCWNNKKWRQLFVINEDVIVSVKDYPQHNPTLTLEITNWLRELAEKNLGWSYDEPIEYRHEEEQIYVDRLPEDKKEFNLEILNENMYNDFGCIDFHWLSLRKDLDESHVLIRNYGYDWQYTYLPLQYSGQAECMVCGQLNPSLADERSLACEDCEARIYCDLCGEPIDGEIYEVEGLKCCEYCYDNRTYTCPSCGDRHFVNNMDAIYIVPYLTEEENAKLKDNYVHICPWDADSVKNCDDMVYYPGVNEADVHVCLNKDCFEQWIKNNLIEGHRPHKRRVICNLDWYVYFDELKPKARDDHWLGEYNTNEEYKESFQYQLARPSWFVD